MIDFDGKLLKYIPHRNIKPLNKYIPHRNIKPLNKYINKYNNIQKPWWYKKYVNKNENKDENNEKTARKLFKYHS